MNSACVTPFLVLWLAICVSVRLSVDAAVPPASPPVPWEQLPAVPMRGDLKVLWDVGGGDRAYNATQAVAHGFQPVSLLNSYSDYPGKQRENINSWIATNRANPWTKPPFFERILRRNIADNGGRGSIFVHDIEFGFEEDTRRAWTNAAARQASGLATVEAFSEAYLREWATWFSLPCRWAREQYPQLPVGIYGPQPFRRDYWGIAGKDARQIDGSHRSDAELWQHIDPFVDFYVASIYVFYDEPGSIFYMASNVEENWQRTRRYGNKPVYAYEWLRFHDSNAKLKGQELTPYLVEAMAVLPYFCGARGVTLWGWEPKLKGQYYQTLPVFMRSISRVSAISDWVARATPVLEEPAHVAWKQQRPLVRKLRLADDDWLVLAVNPWQAEAARSSVKATCGTQTVDLPLHGRHTDIFQVRNGVVTKL